MFKQTAHLFLKASTGNSCILPRQLFLSPGCNTTYNDQRNKEQDGGAKWVMLFFPIAGFALGTWQVKRKQWKLGLIRQLEEKTNQKPRPFPSDLDTLADLEYVPLTVRGQFDHSNEIYIEPRSLVKAHPERSVDSGSLMSMQNKNIGMQVVTPFHLENSDQTILINRGYVPFLNKDPQKRMEGQLTGTVNLTGILRHNETRPPLSPKNRPELGHWLYKDLDDMSKLTGASPIMLDAIYDPSLPPSAPIGGQTRVTLRDEHLSYIVTWYGLSLATGIMWYYRFVKK